MTITVYTDGASRGNPGKSGAGVLIFNEHNRPVASLHEYIGTCTNNEAEYKALIIALEYLPKIWADKNPPDEIIFLSDSQLLVLQMNGKYSVKSPNIIPLYNKAKELLKDIAALKKFEHIPRKLNKEADKLANMAIDGYADIPGSSTNTLTKR